MITTVDLSARSGEHAGLEARVSAWCAREGLSLQSLRHLDGGNSGITLIGTTQQDQSLTTRQFVVKATPNGRPPIGRHDVIRQSRILRLLRPSFNAVPDVLATDEKYPAWFAMTLLEGDATEPVLDRHTLSPAVIEQRMYAAVKILGHLHRVPAAIAEGERVINPADEVQRWARLMNAVPDGLRSRADVLIERLAARVPVSDATGIVHGDFRLGNVVFASDAVSGVIDWEIWSVGDPRIDLAYFLIFIHQHSFPDAANPLPRLLQSDLIAAYESVVGRVQHDIGWFDALARLKLAAAMGHNLRRHRERTHVNPEMERMAQCVPALIESGLACV